MVMVPFLEMSLWVFVWGEGELHFGFFSCFYWAALEFFFLVVVRLFAKLICLVANVALSALFCVSFAELELDTRKQHMFVSLITLSYNIWN
jgi:hypothetical protein